MNALTGECRRLEGVMRLPSAPIPASSTTKPMAAARGVEGAFMFGRSKSVEMTPPPEERGETAMGIEFGTEASELREGRATLKGSGGHHEAVTASSASLAAAKRGGVVIGEQGIGQGRELDEWGHRSQVTGKVVNVGDKGSAGGAVKECGESGVKGEQEERAGKIMVLGGWDGENVLQSSEVLSVVQGGGSGTMWGSGPKMTIPRKGAAVASGGGGVFVLGGWDGTRYSSSAEMLIVIILHPFFGLAPGLYARIATDAGHVRATLLPDTLTGFPIA
jgi:hypothetical protein